MLHYKLFLIGIPVSSSILHIIVSLESLLNLHLVLNFNITDELLHIEILNRTHLNNMKQHNMSNMSKYYCVRLESMLHNC